MLSKYPVDQQRTMAHVEGLIKCPYCSLTHIVVSNRGPSSELELKAFPAAACSCYLVIQSVTPQGVPCTLTVSLCFPENPTSNEVSDFTSVLSTRQDPFALLQLQHSHVEIL